MISTKNIILALTFISLSSSLLQSQGRDEQILKGIEHIYKIEFDSAEAEFAKVISVYPSEPDGYFFLAMVGWWKINIDRSNESYDDEFLKRVDKVIEVADARLKADKYDHHALFYKGGAIGYRGLLRSVRDSWFRAASDGREALNLIEEANKINPANNDAVFGLGLYNYFAEYVPDAYPVLKPAMIFFPKGDKAKGLQQINQAAEKSLFAKTEARYILGFLNLKYEKNFFQAELNFRKLHEDYPTNPVFEKELWSSVFGQSRWNDAYDGWKKVLEKAELGYKGYNDIRILRDANYYTAVSLLNLNRSREAEDYIEKAIEYFDRTETGNSHFKSLAYFFAGEIFANTGKLSKANVYLDKVLSMNNFNGIHEQARIIKSRL